MIPDNLEPIETLEQGVALFERVGMPARDLAERTRHEYTNDLADLAAHLRQRGIAGLRQVDLQHLEGYQAEMDRRGYTREHKTYAIKSFFRFIHHHGVIDTNVALKLTPAPPQVRVPPRPKRPEPRFLSEEEYQRLVRGCSHDPRDACHRRVLFAPSFFCPCSLILLTPVAEELQPIKHVLGTPSIKQPKEAPNDDSNLQLIRNDDPRVFLLTLDVFCMELGEVTTIEGKNRTVPRSCKLKQFGVRETDSASLSSRQDVDLASP